MIRYTLLNLRRIGSVNYRLQNFYAFELTFYKHYIPFLIYRKVTIKIRCPQDDCSSKDYSTTFWGMVGQTGPLKHFLNPKYVQSCYVIDDEECIPM